MGSSHFSRLSVLTPESGIPDSHVSQWGLSQRKHSVTPPFLCPLASGHPPHAETSPHFPGVFCHLFIADDTTMHILDLVLHSWPNIPVLVRFTYKNINIKCSLFANFLYQMKADIPKMLIMLCPLHTSTVSVAKSAIFIRNSTSLWPSSSEQYHALSCLWHRNYAKGRLSPWPWMKDRSGSLYMWTGLIFSSSCILSNSHPEEKCHITLPLTPRLLSWTWIWISLALERSLSVLVWVHRTMVDGNFTWREFDLLIPLPASRFAQIFCLVSPVLCSCGRYRDKSLI